MNLFIHYLDKEILDHLWLPNNIDNLCDELEVSIKIALLLSDTEIYIPFSNYCESVLAKKVIDRFNGLISFGVINLVSSSSSFKDFLEKKEKSHLIYQTPQVKENIEFTLEKGIPGNWRQREKSATDDIANTWNKKIDDSCWSTLYTLTKYKSVAQFEKALSKVPQSLHGQAFVAHNVLSGLRFKEKAEYEVEKIVNTQITKAYISSYLNEFNCVCFKDMNIQGTSIDAMLPNKDREFVSFKLVCKLLASHKYQGMNMFTWIKKCNIYELFELKNSDEWKYAWGYRNLNSTESNDIREKQWKGVKKMKSFIVHGHDTQEKLALKNYIQNTLHQEEPIILAEQPSKGRTIIEKFEDLSSETSVVFVLLTPDDQYGKENRARQNVIFELGYFLGKFGRKSGRIVLLYKGDLDLPSDISGIIYINIDNRIEASGEQIRRELGLG